MYDPARDISKQFLSTVGSWIRASGEVFVVLRYLSAAGCKDYAFVQSSDEFNELINVCPDGTDIIVFREPQLLLRETVTEELINRLDGLARDWKDYQFVVLKRRSECDPRLEGWDDSAERLREDLSDLIGEPIAIGPRPGFLEPDSESMISKSKGGIDGPR